MIKGVNWVDLNQKHRQKQKQFDKLPNREKAKIIVDHINYIGRTEGTENNGEHSLFGTLQNNDNVYEMSKKEILDYIKSKVIHGAYIYKTVISITEEEAKKYGYIDREAFEDLIRQNLSTICNEYNIKFEDMDWVASLHTEEGHIHIHLYFFDNNNERKVEPFVRYYNIKKELNKTVYKQTLESLYEIQNVTKGKIKEIFKEEIEEMYPSEKNVVFNNKIPKKQLCNISNLLNELYEKKQQEYLKTRKMFLENAISKTRIKKYYKRYFKKNS